jgi:hypothetical protein
VRSQWPLRIGFRQSLGHFQSSSEFALRFKTSRLGYLTRSVEQLCA